MNAADEVLEQVKRLLDSSITAYRIQDETGVRSASIYTLRKDPSKIERLRFDTMRKLYNYARTLN